jgi:excisionase family DNA binding protein
MESTTAITIIGTPAEIADGLKRFAAEHATPQAPPPFENEKMTITEAANFIGCHYETLSKWIREGKIRHHGSRKNRFVLRSELIEDYKNLK